MTGLATMVASIVVFLVIANFVTPTVITGTDTGSTLIKAVFLLVVAAIVRLKMATLVSNHKVNSVITRLTLNLSKAWESRTKWRSELLNA